MRSRWRTRDPVQVQGKMVGTAATNASGDASVRYKIPDTLGTESATLSFEFDGDEAYNPDTAIDYLEIYPSETLLTFEDATASPGGSVTLRATLKRATDGAPLAGRTIHFSCLWFKSDHATTDASGVATLTVTVQKDASAGDWGMAADFQSERDIGDEKIATLTISQGGVAVASRPRRPSAAAPRHPILRRGR